MDRDEREKKVLEEEDYIHSPKFGNSLTRFLAKQTKEEVEDETIAKLLLMTPEQVEKIYQEAIEMLKEGLLDE